MKIWSVQHWFSLPPEPSPSNHMVLYLLCQHSPNPTCRQTVGRSIERAILIMRMRWTVISLNFCIQPPWLESWASFIFAHAMRWNVRVGQWVTTSALPYNMKHDNEIYTLTSFFLCEQVIGFIAQIFTILVSIPMVKIVTKVPGVHSFLEVDWLHFIETIMFWASTHVQCMSFRQAVLSVENGKSLPASSEIICCFFSIYYVGCFTSQNNSPLRRAHRVTRPWSEH